VALLVALTTCSAPLALKQQVIPAAAVQPLPTILATGVPRAALGPPSAATLPPATPQPLIAAVAPVEPAASPPLSAEMAQAARRMDEYLQSLTAQNLFSGAVLVARDGRIVLAQGYGSADTQRGIANTPQTRFRLASVTKQFTAMAIMILQSRGALTVDDPICNYLADCPQAWQPVTIRHLLNHTSGIPNYTDFADFAAIETQPATPAALVGRFRELPLMFPPGSAYAYGNSAYVLLGVIIENISGRSYGEFLREALFAPLQMLNSGYDPGPPGSVERAQGYVTLGTPAIALDTSTLFAAGALYSTVEDMFRWDQALDNHALVPPDLGAQMVTPYLEGYAFGWKITDQEGHLRVAHAGLMSGSSTYNARYPNSRVHVIVLSNLESADAPGIGMYLSTFVLQ
jgi:CubicO group peptidase (beta-lactamase class C family)